LQEKGIERKFQIEFSKDEKMGMRTMRDMVETVA